MRVRDLEITEAARETTNGPPAHWVSDVHCRPHGTDNIAHQDNLAIMAGQRLNRVGKIEPQIRIGTRKKRNLIGSIKRLQKMGGAGEAQAGPADNCAEPDR
jgi:hypothetical protein